MKRKMVMSGVGLTSSTATKEVASCRKTEVTGPLGLNGEEKKN